MSLGLYRHASSIFSGLVFIFWVFFLQINAFTETKLSMARNLVDATVEIFDTITEQVDSQCKAFDEDTIVSGHNTHTHLAQKPILVAGPRRAGVLVSPFAEGGRSQVMSGWLHKYREVRQRDPGGPGGPGGRRPQTPGGVGVWKERFVEVHSQSCKGRSLTYRKTEGGREMHTLELVGCCIQVRHRPPPPPSQWRS